MHATQGLESKQSGAFTREELAPLAKVNVTSLKEHDVITVFGVMLLCGCMVSERMVGS